MDYTVKDIKALTSKIATAIESNKEYLGELDGKSGDGDLGISMSLAFTALNDTSKAYQDADIGKMLFQMAKACNKAAPSTMGTLLSSGIMGMAKECKGKEKLSVKEVTDLPRVFANSIMERGKAKFGDKTILDSLVPYCDTFESSFSINEDLKESLEVSAKTAETAAQATSGMKAKMGRAKWLGERAAQYPDAGAILWSIIAQSFL